MSNNHDLLKKCEKLEEELIFWMQQLKESRELLEMEQKNSNRWENKYYQLQIELLVKEKQIAELNEKLNQQKNNVDNNKNTMGLLNEL